VSELVAAGATLNYIDDRRSTAAGPAVVFHHGMGGDLAQPLSLLTTLRLSRLIAPDARGHGASSYLSRTSDASFDLLADDVIRLADHLGLERFVAAGISMGAGVSLNLALRYPERVEALLLARPAWLDSPLGAWKQEIYAAIAELLETEDAQHAATLLNARQDFQKLAAEFPATGSSLRGQLTRPQARQSTAVLRGFPRTAPSSDASIWGRIAVPTLVIAHRDDPFHPYDVGEEHARLIPGATLTTIPSKEADAAGFTAGFAQAVQEFLDEINGVTVRISSIDPEHEDARCCLARYTEELNRRSERTFDPASGATATPDELRAPAGEFFVAYRAGEPIGCGAVKHHRDSPAEIKRMWVAPSARGLGLGRRLLEKLENAARDAGASVARIETNSELGEALTLYRSSGWIEVEPFNEEPYADRWLEKRLI
jgi:pimeloyl-ACP methyl ester carboxylesterase/GNAT superfamily N-acetyltransferase